MAWNVTICSPPSLLRLSTKSRGEVQMLGVASPQMSPTSVIRDAHVDQNHQAVGSPKRQFYSAFDQQQDEVVVEDEVNVIEGSVEGGNVLTTTLVNGKKRRLTGEQVRYLEESFEAENKLEPERKLQIARQLGLQPRQVAVWFQNRRARSKSKQLEREFTHLKAKYDAVLSENRKLHAEVVRLTSLLQTGNDGREGNATQTGMASVGVKIELEVTSTTTTKSPQPNIINSSTLHVNESSAMSQRVLESPKSEVLDSLTPPTPLMMTSSNIGTAASVAVPLPLINPAAAAAAAAAVLAAAKADPAICSVDDGAAATTATILSASTTTTTTTTTATSSPTPIDADFVIANMTTATATSTSMTSNPLLLQQLSLCKLEGGCLTEDYNLIFAQWPDTNAAGAHHLLQPIHHDNNLFIAQYWDEPNIILDPWCD